MIGAGGHHHAPSGSAENDGATIVAVTPGLPADESGLQPGDVIVVWNGERLVETGKDRRWAAGQASRELIARSREYAGMKKAPFYEGSSMGACDHLACRCILTG